MAMHLSLSTYTYTYIYIHVYMHTCISSSVSLIGLVMVWTHHRAGSAFTETSLAQYQTRALQFYRMHNASGPALLRGLLAADTGNRRQIPAADQWVGGPASISSTPTAVYQSGRNEEQPCPRYVLVLGEAIPALKRGQRTESQSTNSYPSSSSHLTARGMGTAS